MICIVPRSSPGVDTLNRTIGRFGICCSDSAIKTGCIEAIQEGHLEILQALHHYFKYNMPHMNQILYTKKVFQAIISSNRVDMLN